MLKVAIMAERDPRSGSLRRGPALRAMFAPPGVEYVTPRGAFSRVVSAPASYVLEGPWQMARSAALQVAAQILSILEAPGADLIHSFFFYGAFVHRLPWIHENDEGPSQFISQYTKITELYRKVAVELLVGSLNSSACRAVVTWTNWARRGFVEDGVDGSKVAVIPPPMRPLAARPRRGTRGRDPFTAVFIGREFLRKGGDVALEAFAKASREVGGIRLIYIGPIPAGVHVPRGVVHRERAEERELHRLLASADAVLSPSRADAYSMTVLEAMAFGAPAIVSDAGGLPELVEHGRAGFVVRRDPDPDPGEVADALARLASDEKLLSSMSASALEIVSRRHSPSLLGAALKRVYEESLAAS